MNEILDKIFLSRKEVAEILGVSICTISRKVRDGYLHPVYIGGQKQYFRTIDIKRLAGIED